MTHIISHHSTFNTRTSYTFHMALNTVRVNALKFEVKIIFNKELLLELRKN